ncbi:MAG: electron transfer flavoprotein subunit beta/FixA family protein [Chloroflexi bacterium]|nr:electron transfer flavoprotein subunit beta/FixA family protein [Chloroflexota bacterium]
MNIVVAIKHVPSLADELELNDEGTNLDFDMIDFALSEWDEQAIEQAALVREASGGEVTAVGIDIIEELDNVLYTALAKGADKAVKIVGDFEPPLESRDQARLLADAIKEMSPDIVLTGVQAIDDLNGQIGPMLAAHLDMPYVGVVVNMRAIAGTATVEKEFAGGVTAEYKVSLPLVVGIQAASQFPRYAPVSRIRQMAKTAKIEEIEAEEDEFDPVPIKEMAKPVAAGHAEMIKGEAEDVAQKIIEIIREKGLV